MRLAIEDYPEISSKRLSLFHSNTGNTKRYGGGESHHREPTKYCLQQVILGSTSLRNSLCLTDDKFRYTYAVGRPTRLKYLLDVSFLL
ncbi:hypothetical protein PNOK_0941200 [Pyrrhoderma noxium]|uniref:Uncharacterized protein n=1 Tax=Pyrrhoderma noxium TaxID=2282107 RepID=A0A286U5R4_9AGAM|nr:hypothetical protein PNOK_0941200 [Pyrrhoderma noxium]